MRGGENAIGSGEKTSSLCLAVRKSTGLELEVLELELELELVEER